MSACALAVAPRFCYGCVGAGCPALKIPGARRQCAPSPARLRVSRDTIAVWVPESATHCRTGVVVDPVREGVGGDLLFRDIDPLPYSRKANQESPALLLAAR